MSSTLEEDIHAARPLKASGISSALVYEGGFVTADGSAIVPDPGDDASVVWIFIHTGQSLSIGARQDPVPRSPITGTATGHYMLSGQQDGGGALTPLPWTLTTLANPARPIVASTGQYPSNTWDEVPMVAMGARLTAIAPSVVSAHEVCGLDGATIEALTPIDPNVNFTFLGICLALREFARLITALGKKPRVAAIVHTHGEGDNGVATYKSDLGNYRNNIEEIARDVTGQKDIIPMFMTQASARYPTTVGSSNTTWQDMVDLSIEQPERFVLVGPKYHLSYDAGDFHLDVPGSRDLGNYYADVWVEWRKHRYYKPCVPITYDRAASTITITYDLEDGDALSFDTSLWASNHSAVWTEWANGRGFEVLDNGSNPVTIASATLVGTNKVVLTASGTWPAGTLYVSYAYYADVDVGLRRGQVRTTSGKWAAHSFATIA